MQYLFPITNLNQNKYINFKSNTPKLTKRALNSLLQEKKDINYIAQLYKCNTETIISLINKYNLKQLFRTLYPNFDVTKTNLEKYIDMGTSLEELSKIFNCSVSQISNKLKTFGLWETHQKNCKNANNNKELETKKIEITEEKLKDLISKKYTKSQLILTFKCSWYKIRTRLIKYNLLDDYLNINNRKIRKKDI